MFGIGQKLSLAFGGLLLLLVAVSVISIARLNAYSGTLDQIFRENYDSITYGQGMKEALERLDDYVDEAVLGDVDVRAAAMSKPDEVVRRFEDNLAREQKNVTLPGEGAAVAAVSAAWQSYKSAIEDLCATPDRGKRDSIRNERIVPLSVQIKPLAQQIIEINLNNIVSVDGEVRHATVRAKRMLYAFMACGIVLASILAFVMSRSILMPLRSLTRSAREIEQGNLELVVNVRGHDELAQLGDAFNAMAARLREFRRSERAKLVRTQRSTQLAVRSLPDGVALVSPEGVVELANDTASRLFGLKPDASLSNSTAPSLLDLYRRARDGGRPIGPGGYDTVIQVFDAHGTERFYLPQAIPILDEDVLVGVTIVLADVTNLRKLDEMKSGLLSVVSHELKTPLTSIRMAAHLMLDERLGPLTSKQTDVLLAARDDSDRLHSIIENLLEIGRIESGRVTMELSSIAARQLVENAIDDVDAAYREKGVTLEMLVDDDVPHVRADGDRIGHVFTNLLTNALRYTPSGGRVKVVAQRQPSGNLVRFAVIDTGIGIDAAYLPRLFDRFFRVPGQPGRTGVGLGLAIAREIVEAHGGELGVHSHVGEGAEFGFTLHADTGDQPVETLANH